MILRCDLQLPGIIGQRQNPKSPYVQHPIFLQSGPDNENEHARVGNQVGRGLPPQYLWLPLDPKEQS